MASSWFGCLFKRFSSGDSIHKAVNADNFNKIFNILEDIKGEGCRIEKTQSGLGWKIVIDGSSDIETTSNFMEKKIPWSHTLIKEDDDFYIYIYLGEVLDFGHSEIRFEQEPKESEKVLSDKSNTNFCECEQVSNNRVKIKVPPKFSYIFVEGLSSREKGFSKWTFSSSQELFYGSYHLVPIIRYDGVNAIKQLNCGAVIFTALPDTIFSTGDNPCGRSIDAHYSDPQNSKSHAVLGLYDFEKDDVDCSFNTNWVESSDLQDLKILIRRHFQDGSHATLTYSSVGKFLTLPDKEAYLSEGSNAGSLEWLGGGLGNGVGAHHIQLRNWNDGNTTGLSDNSHFLIRENQILYYTSSLELWDYLKGKIKDLLGIDGDGDELIIPWQPKVSASTVLGGKLSEDGGTYCGIPPINEDGRTAFWAPGGGGGSAEDIDNLEKAVEEIKKDVKANTSNIENLQTNLQQVDDLLSSSIDNLRTDMEINQQEFAGFKSEINTSINDLTISIEKINQQFNVISSRLDAIERRLDGLV